MNFKLVITFSFFFKCTRHQYFIHENIKYDITSKTFCGILKFILKRSFLLLFPEVLFFSCLSFYSPRQVTAVLFSTRNNLPGPLAYKTLTPGNCIDWQQPLWGRQRDLGVSSSPTGNCFHSHLQGLGWKGWGCKVKYGNKLF